MTEFTLSHLFGLSIFASYFLAILSLFYVVISSIARHAKCSGANRLPALTFAGLTATSLAHTWYWMFRFMDWSFRNYEDKLQQRDTWLAIRVASWLKDTGLFEQAWYAVCKGPFNWWWSEQLCLFTAGAFTVFLFLQRERVPHVWAYMLLGQLVAISVAWSLLNLAFVLIPRPTTSTKTKSTLLPPLLTIPVLLSMLTIYFSPLTSATTFLPNLLIMHALLVLPVLPIPSPSSPSITPHASSFYTLLTVLSFLLRVRTTLVVLSALKITSSPFFSWRYPLDFTIASWTAPVKIYKGAWQVLHAHPAQASIGWDIVWTTIVWIAWCALQQKPRQWRALVIAKRTLQGTFTSVGVIAPLEFGRALIEEELLDEIKGE